MDKNWASALCFNALLLIACSFAYSWSAFKLDLKKVSGLDEAAMAWIFTASNFGQNFVVHMGYLYDRCGVRVAGVVSLLCKVGGLLGLYFVVTSSITDPALIALLFFLETQASGLAIIIVQVEAQKVVSNPSLRGVTASMCTAAFGLGAVVWTSAYDIAFQPHLDKHFLCGGFVGGAFILLGIILHPIFSRNAPTASPNSDSSAAITSGTSTKPKPNVLQICLSAGFISCSLATCITWGTAVLWISNMANFATAAQMTNGAEVRFAFNVMGFAGRITSGPITDLFSKRLPLEFFTFATAAMSFTGAVIMIVTDGQLLLPAAIISGFGFGSISTLVPLICRQVAPHCTGAVYAISKISAMAVSSIWLFYTGKWVEEAKGENATCIGVKCYQDMWVMIMSTTAPIMMYLLVSLLRTMREFREARKKDLALCAAKKKDNAATAVAEKKDENNCGKADNIVGETVMDQDLPDGGKKNNHIARSATPVRRVDVTAHAPRVDILPEAKLTTTEE